MVPLKNMKKFAIPIILFLVVVTIAIWWVFFKSIGSFEDLSKGIYSADEYAALGKKFEDAGQWKDAEQAYLEAINLSPALQLQAYVGLDKIYQEKLTGKEDDIERLYLRGISYNPQSRALLRGLAQYYERVKNYTAAYQWYGMVIQYYPEDSDSRDAALRVRGKIQQ